MLLALTILIALPLASAGGVRAIRLRRLGSDAGDEPDDSSFMWGSCSDALHDATGCDLDDGLVCSSFLSNGPEDADVVLNITGLPPSTPDTEIHMHWWAVRKSPSQYEPMKGPEGSSVYFDFRKAYPLYTDEANFNGGNARVDESGKVTIRVRQPATYVLGNFVLMPHIHIRFCSGVRFTYSNADTIFFTRDGPRYVQGYHGPEHENATVDGSQGVTTTPYPSTTSSSSNSSSTEEGVTTTPYPSTTSSSSNSSSADEGVTTTPYPSTTSSSSTSSSEDEEASTTTTSEDADLVTDTDGLVDLRIQDAIEVLDLDALEFSPVYTCLLAGRFYSYFTSSCVMGCPAETVVYVGQCVRPENTEESIVIEAAWELSLECDTYCWHSKLNVTMHHVRLAAAHKLNIPFQEVVRASFMRTARRRLAEADPVLSTAIMHIVVNSKRVAPGTDETVLRSLFTLSSGTSWLLGFVVRDVQATTPMVIEGTGEGIVITDSNDPYQSAYGDAAPEAEFTRATKTDPASSVPVWAVAVAGCGVLLIGVVCTIVGYRRRQTRSILLEVVGVPVLEAFSSLNIGPTKPTTPGAPARPSAPASIGERPGTPQHSRAAAGSDTGECNEPHVTVSRV